MITMHSARFIHAACTLILALWPWNTMATTALHTPTGSGLQSSELVHGLLMLGLCALAATVSRIKSASKTK